MDERELTERLLTDHFNVAGALVDMQLMRLSDDPRSRVFDACTQSSRACGAAHPNRHCEDRARPCAYRWNEAAMAGPDGFDVDKRANL